MAKIGEFFKSNYFNADSLLDGDLTLTISNCQAEVFPAREKGKNDEQKMVVYFEEDERGLGLNVTNWNTIIEVTGEDDTDNWPGHQITLTRKKDKGIGGQLVWCVRVRDTAQPSSGRNQPPQQRPQPSAASQRAVAAQQGRGVRPPAQIDESDEVPF